MAKSSEERRAEIVQVALELAGERGVGNVSTQAIADRVGIAQPTVFRHFKTRDAIFRAAIQFIAAGLFKALEGVFSGAAPADERLQRLIERQLAFIGGRRGIPRLLFSDRLHHEDPELKATVRAVMDRYTGHVARLIEEGVRQGRFRADVDPEESARLLAAVMQGLIMRWSVYDYAFPLESQSEAVWRLMRSALATDQGERDPAA
jgi:TetR/AcrR family transcriptional regulator